MQTVHSDHSRLDERSLAMHQLIATKVQADPALLDKARENVRRWQASDGSPKLALAEWEQILDGPPQSGRAIPRGTLRARDPASPVQPVRGDSDGSRAPHHL